MLDTHMIELRGGPQDGHCEVCKGEDPLPVIRFAKCRPPRLQDFNENTAEVTLQYEELQYLWSHKTPSGVHVYKYGGTR